MTASMTLSQMRATLEEAAQINQKSPVVIPEILALAMQINAAGADGVDTQEIFQQLMEDSIEGRARHHASFVGSTQQDQNAAKTFAAFDRLAYDQNGYKRSVKEFEKEIYALYGAVFTGHPVFNMTKRQGGLLSQYASLLAKGDAASEEAKTQASAKLHAALKEGFKPLTIDEEADSALTAIAATHDAIDDVVKAAIAVGKKHYPEAWHTINYMPVTVATWIPFDWDGRTDVKWHQLLEKRIELQLLKFERDIGKFNNLAATLDQGEARTQIQNIVTVLQSSQEKMRHHHEGFKTYNQKEDVNGVQLGEMTNALESDAQDRITHPHDLIEAVQNIIDITPDETLKEKLVAIRSDLKHDGISFARTHYRLNAKSVLNALREEGFEGNMEGDAKEADISYRNKLAQMISQTEELSSNLVTVAQATESIVQQMALIRQVRDFIDSYSPVRFLIAESDRAIVPMGALHFASKIGITDCIEISALFEDRAGQDNFERVLDSLLDNPDFLAQIKQSKDHDPLGMVNIALQFGYSDSGRYDGVAAAAYMDKIKGKMIRKLVEKGLVKDESELRFTTFDTHGDSLGRAQNCDSAADAVRYNQTGHLLHFARQNGIKITSEKSHQGMDGYINFLDKDMAFAMLANSLDYLTDAQRHEQIAKDPYYNELKGDALAFYATARSVHDQGVKTDGYADLISAFVNTAPITGSRPVKRAAASGGERQLPRAIQHNGVLMRLGEAANVTYGVAQAIKEDPERFKRLVEQSPEFRFRMRMVEEAVSRQSPSAMRAYINVYNPEFWQHRAEKAGSPQEAKQAEVVAAQVRRTGIYKKIEPIVAMFEDNYRTLKTYFPQAHANKKDVFNRQITHGMRIANMITLFEATTKIPDVPNRHDTTRDEIVKRIINFDPRAIDELKTIYPTVETSQAFASNVSRVVDMGGKKDSVGYEKLHEQVLEPMEKALDNIIQLAHPLMHYDRAVG